MLFKTIFLSSAARDRRGMGYSQGRNFGLKSEGYQFRRRTRRPWVLSRKGRRMVWMGRKYLLLIWLWGLRVSWALPARSGAKMVLFQFNLRRSPLLTAGDSKFFTFSSWKVGVVYPSVQKVGVPVPLVSYAIVMSSFVGKSVRPFVFLYACNRITAAQGPIS